MWTDIFYAPWLLVIGIGMVAGSWILRMPDEWRGGIRSMGSVLSVIAVVWFGVLLFSTPGQENVVPVKPEEKKPGPTPELSLSEKLKQPWSTTDYPDWPVATVMAELCQLGYQRPVQARAEFDRLGFKSETIEAASLVGYVLLIDDTAIVILRGTDDTPDWLQNIQFLPKRTTHGVIHSGFHDGYQDLHLQVVSLLKQYKPQRIWITGHSLGGALAVVSAYQLIEAGETRICGLITFGQPMVVRSDLRSFLAPNLDGKFVHFANGMDPVARLTTPYEHFGTLILLKNGELFRSSGDRLFAGAPPDKDAPVFKTLSPRELEKLKAELRREKRPKRQKAGKEKMGDGWFPSVADHYMPEYIQMLRTISEKRFGIAPIVVE